MRPTMNSPTDHELELVLARAAGVEIAEFRPEEWYCVANPADIASGSMRWNPLHDANQMEMVEAWLRENGWEYISGWSRQGSSHWAELRNSKKAFWSSDINKKRAFALAVYAWWNEQKKEKAT